MPTWLAPVFEKSAYFMPHGHCYLWIPTLLWLHVASDFLIGLAYVGISQILWLLVQRLRLPFSPVFIAFGLFIGLCGLTHFMEIWTVWNPDYWAEGLLKAATAAASVATAVGLYFIRPQIEEVVHAARLSEERRVRLESTNAELEALYAKVKELDEQKSAFFANVSHELRTPLALILGPAEQLLEDEQIAGRGRHKLESIVGNAQILLKQVNDLLDVSKLEAGRMAPRYAAVDVAYLLRLTVGQFELVAEQRAVSIELSGPEHAQAQLDTDMVSRSFINLMSNALKFTPAGGQVNVSLAERRGELCITVEDSGPGVAQEQRELIFERFRQADSGATRRYAGTGLGLAIVKDFVELHHGTVTVGESVLGGASFTLTLPKEAPAGTALTDDLSDVGDSSAQTTLAGALREIRPAVPGERSETSGSSADDRPRLLVVEDNPEMREFVADILHAEYHITTADDGRHGLAQAQALRPDLIITDMMMPDMSGDQLLHALRSMPEFAAVPVLMLTAKADDELKVRLLRSGAQDYLAKPFLPQELRARVANHLAMKRAGDTLRGELASLSVDLEELAREVAAKNRELQTALEVAQVARLQAERATEVKSYFLGMMSHELRTPMATIQMNLDLLQRDGAQLSEAQRRRIERLLSASRQIGTVLEGVLEYARISSERIETRNELVDLGALVRERVKHHAELAPEHVAIELAHGDQAVPALQSDPQLLRVIVDNLLSNAVKFTEQGVVQASLTVEKGWHTIEVRDTGIGIPRADLDRIFEPFEQLEPLRHKSIPGVGLGLALVKELTQALNGTIAVTSTPGKGTIFTVQLPSAPASRT